MKINNIMNVLNKMNSVATTMTTSIVTAASQELPNKESSPPKQSKFRSRYSTEVQSILCTNGDARSPLPETVLFLEELIHGLLISILREAVLSAVKRGARTFVPEDLVFILRYDMDRVSRIREYLCWREVRKSAKPEEGVNPMAPEIAFEEENPPVHQHQQPVIRKRPSYRLPWSIINILDQDLLAMAWQEGDDQILNSIDDSCTFSNVHLMEADTMTLQMSREEYLDYSECRQSASFTYKKMKKFREWLAPGSVTDYRVNDDVLEILGLIAGELGKVLVRRALKCKQFSHMDLGDVRGVQVSLFAKPSAKSALRPVHFKMAVDGAKLDGDLLFRPIRSNRFI